MRNILNLIRIQALPASTIIALIGYVFVEGTVFTEEAWLMLIPLAVGNFAFYIHNDMVDMEWDSLQDKTNPIIENTIRVKLEILVAGLGLLGLFLSQLFGLNATLSLLAAYIAVYVYNRRSKTDLFSPFYLGIWSVCILYYGSSVAGSLQIPLPLSVVMFISISRLTIEANVKDSGHGEISFPELYGDRVPDIIFALMVVELIQLSVLINYQPLLLIVFSCYVIMFSVTFYLFDSDGDEMNIILLQKLPFAFAFLVVLTDYTRLIDLALIFSTSFGWVIFWRTVLEGSLFTVPQNM